MAFQLYSSTFFIYLYLSYTNPFIIHVFSLEEARSLRLSPYLSSYEHKVRYKTSPLIIKRRYVGEEARGITPIIGVIVEVGSQVGPTGVQLNRCSLQSVENNTNTYINIETRVDCRTLCPPLLSFIQETKRRA
jgi:hypothetical protein